jgi:hypothetical protein
MLDERNADTRFVNCSTFNVSHSHITKTFQPRLRRRCKFLRSRRTTFASFGCQYVALLTTRFRFFRHECECQKHPRTSIIFFNLGNTKSGVPGRSRRCRRNLCPSPCAILRTSNSGAVCLLRIIHIRELRCCGVKKSIMLRPSNHIHPQNKHTVHQTFAAVATLIAQSDRQVVATWCQETPRSVNRSFRG